MKVLIVEDETAAAVNLQAILRKVAPTYEVLAVLESIEDTVDYFRDTTQTAPDLVFMDIHLADGESFRIFDAVTVSSTTCSSPSRPRTCSTPSTSSPV